MEKELFKKYYSQLISGGIIILITMIIICYIVINTKNVLNYIVILIYAGILIYTLIKMLPIFRDFDMVRKRKYIQITGEVIKTRIKIESYEPYAAANYVTIVDNITSQEIELQMMNEKIEFFQIDTGDKKTYTFLYFPHTKYAVVFEQTT